MFATEVDVIEIDSTAGNKNTSFAVVSGSSNQRTLLVVRNLAENLDFSVLNQSKTITETVFTLNLIDSSTGTIVCKDMLQYAVIVCMYYYT